MSRIFIAVDLPEVIKEELTELCAFGLPGIRWVDPRQLHLSLRFLGEIDPERLNAVDSVLSRIRGRSFTLSLKGVGTFPQAKTPRVVWVGVEKCAGLLGLQKKVEVQLSQIGILGETRKFFPHVTLGRVASKKIGRMGDYLRHYDQFKTEPFEISQFAIFSSHLTPQGARYTKEKIFDLL